MVQWDGRWEQAAPFPGMEQFFAGMFRRLSQAVPGDVELGFHLCYGDLEAAHFVEPVDAAKMVELANLMRPAPRPALSLSSHRAPPGPVTGRPARGAVGVHDTGSVSGTIKV
jgi:hypothetical protein